MSTEGESKLDQAIQRRSEYFASTVKPKLDALDHEIPLGERLQRIDPEVRRQYQELCRKVRVLRDESPHALHDTLTPEECLLRLGPRVSEACRLEREMCLLLLSVADLQADGTCAPIKDARIRKRARRLRELFRDVRGLMDCGPMDSGGWHAELHEAVEDSDAICRDLVEGVPLGDTAFQRLDTEAGILAEFLERNRGAFKSLGLLTRG